MKRRTHPLMISIFMVNLLISAFVFTVILSGQPGYAGEISAVRGPNNRPEQIHFKSWGSVDDGIRWTSTITEPEFLSFLPLIYHHFVVPVIGDWIRFPGPNLPDGVPGSWDDGAVFCPSVSYDGTAYRMWYTGRQNNSSVYQLGYAISLDGYTWEKYQANPVLEVGPPGSWDETQVGHPTVFYDGSIWNLWYTGYSDAQGVNQIGYATSLDGITWTKYEHNPVLKPGPQGSWDEEGPREPSVVFKDGIYHMWYSSLMGNRGFIGYATSTDGIHWLKHAENPVIGPGDGQELSRETESPHVIEIFGIFQMWYNLSIWDRADFNLSVIKHMVSVDGIHWIPGSADLPSIWPFGLDFCPNVVIQDGYARMWYSHPGSIEYAEAPMID